MKPLCFCKSFAQFTEHLAAWNLSFDNFECSFLNNKRLLQYQQFFGYILALSRPLQHMSSTYHSWLQCTILLYQGLPIFFFHSLFFIAITPLIKLMIIICINVIIMLHFYQLWHHKPIRNKLKSAKVFTYYHVLHQTDSEKIEDMGQIPWIFSNFSSHKYTLLRNASSHVSSVLKRSWIFFNKNGSLCTASAHICWVSCVMPRHTSLVS